MKQRAQNVPTAAPPAPVDVIAPSPAPTPTLAPGWVEIGRGPCADEVVRMKNFAMGVLIAVVKQTRGYPSTSVVNPDPRAGNELVVKSEQTVSLTYTPGAHLAIRPPEPSVTASEPAAASLQERSVPSPETGASSPEPAPGAAAAGATGSR